MPRNYKFRILVSMLLAVVFVPASAQVANLPRTAELLPPETVFLIDIADFTQLKAQFEQTNLYKLYNDPVMGPFVEQVKAKFNEKIASFDQNNCIRALVDTGIFPQKRAAMAIVVNEQNVAKKELPLILIIEWGQENLDKIKEALKTMMEKNVELGGRRTANEDFQGITIESAVDEGGTEFSYCFIDDCLIVTLDIETLKFAIAHTQGAGSPTLASDTEFQNILNASGPVHDIDIFVNIRQIIKNALANDTTGRRQTTAKNLGFENITGLGASLAIARTPGSWYSGKALLKVNGEKKGVCRLFDSRPAALEVPSFVPTWAYRVSLFNLNAQTVFNELSQILNSFNPMFASFLYTPLVPASPSGEPELKLKEDIIDYLGSQIIVAEGLKKPFSVGPEPFEYIAAISTTNRSALEKSLAVLHRWANPSDDAQTKIELLGHTIYLIGFGSMPFTGAKPGPGQEPNQDQIVKPKMAFTVTDTHLIAGLDSSVEQAIRALNSGESVVNSKWLAAAKSASPSSALMAGFDDNRTVGEYFWYIFKKSDESNKKKRTPDFGLGPVDMVTNQGLDFSVLPEFDQIKKYLGITAWNLNSRPDGFFADFKTVDYPGD